MKVYCESYAHLSRAMWRVSEALKRHAPSNVEFVQIKEEADLEVLHVIGPDALDYASPSRYTAVIQYCTNKAEPKMWWPLWERASVVWSYYDLAAFMPRGANFYHSPLGIDPPFLERMGNIGPRSIGVVTSGYVSGNGAEAIEDAAQAASLAGLTTTHIGPSGVEVSRPFPKGWRSLFAISDAHLAEVYQRARWVSGLRYVEGFELPAIEGLSRGARPIVFDRPDMRQWYEGHAVFVPECSGPPLVDALRWVFSEQPLPVTREERETVVAKFDWGIIAEGFWSAVARRIEVCV